MKSVNTYTDDTVITVSARVNQSTWKALKIKAAEENKRISQIYNIAIRQYLGLDREVRSDN
jgi:hypothetical protein